MTGIDGFLAVQVGYGSRQLESSVKRPGRKVKRGHGLAEESLGVGLHFAEFAHVLGSHLGVAGSAGSAEPGDLDVAGRLDPGPDALRSLRLAGSGQLLVLDVRHLDVDVDAVEQRSRQTPLVAEDR